MKNNGNNENKRNKGKLKTALINVGWALLHILITGVVFINLYTGFLKMPEWLALIIAVVWVAAVNVLQYTLSGRNRGEKKSRKIGGKITFAVLDLIILTAMVGGTYYNRYWNSDFLSGADFSRETSDVTLTRDEALKDFDYAMKYLLKIHPETIDGLPGEMENKAAEVRKGLEGIDTIKGYELSREIEGIFSMLGDGHTHIQEVSAEYHYMKHIYECKKMKAVACGINGIAFSEFLKENPGLVSYEREEYGIRILKNRISTLEGLKYLGVDTSGSIIYNYVLENGENYDVTVTADDFLTLEDYYDYEEKVTGDDLRAGDDGTEDFVSFEIDKQQDLAVLKLSSCRYNSHYREVLKQMFNEVEAEGISNIAVDLRGNSGGSSMVADEFIHYLDVDEYKGWSDEIRYGNFIVKNEAKPMKNRKKGAGFKGNVFVLTDISSFSASMDFAMLIQDNGIGKVVGEASGNMPASCGDIAIFTLPESGLVMQVSSKKWHRVDESKESLPVIPDYECNPEDALSEVTELIRQADGNR